MQKRKKQVKKSVKTKAAQPTALEPRDELHPAVEALAREVRSKLGNLDIVLGPYQEGKRTRAYFIQDKGVNQIVVFPGSKGEDLDHALAHELIHGLQNSKTISGSEKIAKGFEKLGFLDKRSVVLPKHWTEGKVDTPLMKDTGRPPCLYDSRTRVNELMNKTASRRLGEVETIVPKAGSYSGVRSRLSEKFLRYHSTPYTESESYYMTHSRVPDRTGRATEAGMFLLDHGIPFTVVQPVVDLLKGE